MERKEEIKKRGKQRERRGRIKFLMGYGVLLFILMIRKSTRSWGSRSVKVNIQPFAITAVPHARFFVLLCVRLSLSEIRNRKKNQMNFHQSGKTRQLTCPRIESGGRMQCRPRPRPSNGCEGWGSVCWLICNSCLELDDKGIRFENVDRYISTNFCFFTVVEEEFVELESFH